jgi:N6-L-threonylcarbamoyladenine synthase
MLILGVETSCDETAAAVVEDGKRILSDVIASQIAVHSPYGGVVPELASRKHVEAILPVIARALEEAQLPAEQLDAIAVTQGPGLVGALLVGIGAAKAMAYALGKPLIAVSHLEGHMHAAFLGQDPPREPFVCLVVSGGHTALYRVDPDGENHLLGSTRDDAAGEAFDKVAKLLGLGYPGGIEIDRIAVNGDPTAFSFPRAFKEKDSLEFSFSGLKTSVANFVRAHGMPAEAAGSQGAYRLEDLVASFQEAVVDVLVAKTFKAAHLSGVRDVAVVGGVAANSRLRHRLMESAAQEQLRIHLPPLRFCTDNAVMIAAAGFTSWKRSGFCPNPLDLDAKSRWLTAASS